MKTTRSIMLPVDILWEYREFKRDEVSSPRIPFIHSYTIDEITLYVSLYGIDPVELSVISDRALLTDGNHRIVAARRLGYDHIPVIVTNFPGNGRQTFYEHTLERFRVITKELEAELNKC